MITSLTRRAAVAILGASVALTAAGPALAQTTMNLGWGTPLDSNNGVFA